MNMAEVNDWKFTLGNTLPVGLWPTKVPKMKAPAEPEAQPLKAPAGVLEVSGAGYIKMGKQIEAVSWAAVEAIINGDVSKVVKWYVSGPAIFNPMVGILPARAEAPQPAIQPATIKLSEAIRIGGAKLRHVRGTWGDGLEAGCAMTAGLRGIGLDIHLFGNLEGLSRLWPGVPARFFAEVMQRNDTGEESFEQIADWVAAQGY